MDEEFEEEIPEPDKEILKNPYLEVCKFAETRLKLVGHKIFSSLSLMPVSLVAPDIPYGDTKVRSNIHVMLLSAPGGGKNFASNILQEISYNPIDFTAITSAGTEETLFGMDYVTLIIPEMAKIIQDVLMVKTLEGLCGEEKKAGSITVSRGDKRINLDVTTFMAGVPQDITSYISSGLIFRFTPILCMHDKKTHDNIGKEISKNIGKASSDMTIQKIKTFYKWIYHTQLGKNKEFPKIDGYVFDDVQREMLYKKWESTLGKVNASISFNWFRELWSGARYMCSSAIMNRYNRKIENNMIVPNESDLKLGMFLMAEEIKLKSYLLSCNKIAKRLGDIKYLEKYADKNNINNLTLEILQLILAKKKV